MINSDDHEEVLFRESKINNSKGALFFHFFLTIFYLAGFAYLFLPAFRADIHHSISSLFEVKSKKDSSSGIFSKYNRSNIDAIITTKFDAAIKKLEKDLGSRGLMESGEIENLKKSLEGKIIDEIGENIAEKFKKDYGANVKRENDFIMIDDTFSSLRDHLESERRVASNRGFLNLIAGLGLAAVGLYVLTGLLSAIEFENANWQIPLFQIGSRLSVVAFIGIFAFFFLNIYRLSQQELKYYRNELMNVILRQTAMRAALTKLTKDDLSTITM